jgi:hypothetical protein
MRYGRSHEEREQKIYSRAKINVHGTIAHSDLMPPVSPKSNAAPTARAVERERLRHQEERKHGRTAAGTHGVLRDQRAGVSRDTLTEAAHTADTRLERRSQKPKG